MARRAGLVQAIQRCFDGAGWQPLPLRPMRNLIAAANHRHHRLIAALNLTIFVGPDIDTATVQLRAVVDQHRPLRAGGRRSARSDGNLPADTGFPQANWLKIWSNNPIDRSNRELKRCTDVAGIFRDKASVIRRVDALLVEI